MAEVKIRSPNIKVGRTGAVLVVIIAAGLYGLAVLRSFSNFEDPVLEEVIRTELSTDLGGRTLESLEQMRESGDFSGLEEQLEMFDAEAIQILRMNLSQPILGWENRSWRTIYVRYTTPESPANQERYLRCEQVSFNSWRSCMRSTAVSFYLEVLPF